MTTPAPPALVGIPGVPLIDTGDWHAASGPWSPTPDDLAAAVAALDCPSVRRPTLKLGHTGVHGQGDPLIGYVTNLRLEQQGHRLVGDFAGMPAWLAAEATPGAGSVVSSAYPDRSVEGQYGYHCQAGHTHPFVVTAVALLGVEHPAIGTLTSLQDLYGVSAAAGASAGAVVSTTSPTKERPVTSPAGAVAASHSIEDVRRAYYATAGSDWMWWIRQVHADPNQLIVENDEDGRLYRVPFDAAGDEVVFGDPVPVVVEYRDVAAGRGPTLAQLTGGRLLAAAWASKDESRPGGPARPSASAAGTTPTPEGGSMDPAKLREALGLPADATDEQVTTALDEAGIVAPAPSTTPTTGVPGDHRRPDGFAGHARPGARRRPGRGGPVRPGRCRPGRREPARAAPAGRRAGRRRPSAAGDRAALATRRRGRLGRPDPAGPRGPLDRPARRRPGQRGGPGRPRRRHRPAGREGPQRHRH